MGQLIVTLDGPAGTGKSTMARQLARRLGLDFLDTGAMYRGLTACVLDQGLDPTTQPEGVVALAGGCTIRFDWQQDPPALLINGDPVGPRLRDHDVTEKASVVAALGPVRQVMVDAQRRIGREHPRLVTEGRDQGSVVFPDAQVKFYLDADPAVRAHRRAEQLRAAGEQVDDAQILEEIRKRDERDTKRKDGPLVVPAGAVRLDTSQLSPLQVLDLLESEVRTRCGDALRDGGAQS